MELEDIDMEHFDFEVVFEVVKKYGTMPFEDAGDLPDCVDFDEESGIVTAPKLGFEFECGAGDTIEQRSNIMIDIANEKFQSSIYRACCEWSSSNSVNGEW